MQNAQMLSCLCCSTSIVCPPLKASSFLPHVVAYSDTGVVKCFLTLECRTVGSMLGGHSSDTAAMCVFWSNAFIICCNCMAVSWIFMLIITVCINLCFGY